MSEENVRPNDTIVVKVNKEPREIFMSSGLLRNIILLSGDISEFQQVYMDFALQNSIMIEMLRPRTEHGNAITEPSIDDFEMSVEDGNRLIDWAVEHILNFFVDTTQRAMLVAQKNENLIKKMVKLTPSQDGTQA